MDLASSLELLLEVGGFSLAEVEETVDDLVALDAGLDFREKRRVEVDVALVDGAFWWV